MTFLLTSGGHNAGIVSEPGHPHRRYRVSTKAPGDVFVDPATWEATTPVAEGSWWPEWQAWLAARSGTPAAELIAAASAGRTRATLPDAPGSYVLQP